MNNKNNFTEKDKRIFQKMKDVVLGIDSSAEIILFGSRARGDFKEDSDYDFLILTKNEVNHKFRTRIFNAVYDVQLEEEVITQEVIRNKDEWETKHTITPLYYQISNDGIKL